MKSRDSSDEYERSPAAGVRKILAELLHGGTQSRGFAFALLQAGVEQPHEFGRTAVLNIPKREQESPRSGVEQPSDEAKEFVSSRHNVQARGTAARRGNSTGSRMLRS